MRTFSLNELKKSLVEDHDMEDKAKEEDSENNFNSKLQAPVADPDKSLSDVGSAQANYNSSKRTLFSEFEALEIVIKIIELLEFLHDKNIIHTNLNPSNIFLKKSNTKEMCFINLYHCSWKPE